MNIAALLPQQTNNGCSYEQRRAGTASESNNLQRDYATFDDSTINRKRYLLLRRLPHDGLIRRLIANPPKIVSEDAITTLMDQMRSSYTRRRPPMLDSPINIQSSTNRGAYCSLRHTRTYDYFGRSTLHRSFALTDHRRTNTEETSSKGLRLKNKTWQTKKTKEPLIPTEFDKLARVTTVTLEARSMTSRSRKVRANQNKPTTANPNCKCTRSPREVLSTTPGTLANTLLNTPTNYTSRNRPFFFKKSPNFSKRTCQPIETQLKPIEIISGWDTIE